MYLVPYIVGNELTSLHKKTFTVEETKKPSLLKKQELPHTPKAMVCWLGCLMSIFSTKDE